MGGHHKIGLDLGVISMFFRVFSKFHGTMWDFFGLLKFQILFGVLDISDIFWGDRVGDRRCWVYIQTE